MEPRLSRLRGLRAGVFLRSLLVVQAAVHGQPRLGYKLLQADCLAAELKPE